MYSEFGDLLASKLATYLYTKHSKEVMISPPYPIHETQLHILIKDLTKDLTKEKKNEVYRTYAHFHKDSIILINTIIIPTPSEGIGYA